MGIQPFIDVDAATDLTQIHNDLTTIDGKIDTVDANVDTINGKVDTIDANVDDSVEGIEEIEQHIHNVARWLGNGATEDSLTGYTVTSGNGAFGSETVILTALQTPVDAGKVAFDLHRVVPLTISNSTPFIIRWIYGTGTVADAEAAKQYSESVIISTGTGTNVRGTSIEILMPKLPAGTKIWAKCKNATNLANITFLVGLHEYDS